MTGRALFSSSGIVPALDVDSLDHLDRVVSRTTTVKGVVGYKLGLTTVLRLGLKQSVDHMRTLTDLPVIYDHQKAGADMPDMGKTFCKLCKDAGVDSVILFPVAGPTAVHEFAGRAARLGLSPIVGGEIPVDDYKIGRGGYMAASALDRIIEVAASVKVRHFVLPARHSASVRRRANWIAENVRKPVLFLTGIGPLGGDIATAFSAAQSVRTRIAVVGRLITKEKNPAEAAKRCVDQIFQ